MSDTYIERCGVYEGYMVAGWAVLTVRPDELVLRYGGSELHLELSLVDRVEIQSKCFGLVKGVHVVHRSASFPDNILIASANRERMKAAIEERVEALRGR